MQIYNFLWNQSYWSVLVAWLCPTLCDPIGYGSPGSSVHGILQARILEWAAIPFSRGSSQSRDQTQISFIAGRFLTIWDTREAQVVCVFKLCKHASLNILVVKTYFKIDLTHNEGIWGRNGICKKKMFKKCTLAQK